MIAYIKKIVLVLFFLLCGSFVFSLPRDTVIEPSLLWVRQMETSIYTRLIVRGGVLYFGDLDNYVYALSSHDGSLLWKRRLRSRDILNPGGIKSTFVWYKSFLIVVTVDGFLYSLSAVSGEVLWGSIDLGEEVYSSPVLVGDYLFVVTGVSGRVFVLKALTGEFILKKFTGFRVETTPAIKLISVEEGGVKKDLYNVYITLRSRLLFFRVHIEERVLLDITTVPIFNKGMYVSSPIIYSSVSGRGIVRNTLFFATGKYVYSVNADLLRVNWVVRTGIILLDEFRGSYPSPFVIGDRLFFSSFGYDRDLGSPVWNVFLYGLPTTDSAYTKGCIYFGGRYKSYGSVQGYLACVDRATESIIFNKGLSSFPLSPITVADRTVYFSTQDGKLYAFR